MSRSYKKYPALKYAPMGNSGQILANRRIRRGKYRDLDIPDGCYYKRLYCQYDIHDHIDRETLSKYMLRWERWERWYPSVSDVDYNWYGRDENDAKFQWKKRYILK